MNLPQYVVFGEALTDMLLQADGRWTALPGGACWNVARVGARLGVPTAFAGAVSQDLFGDELEQAGTAAGLDGRFLQRVDKLPFLAMVTSQHPPQYFFVGADSADLYFDPGRLPDGWREAAKVVHFGGISMVRQPLAGKLVAEALAAGDAGVKVAFDPNFRGLMRDPHYLEIFRAVAAVTSYLKVSDEDLGGLFPGHTLADAVALVRTMAPHARILYTKGAQGMTLLDGRNVVDQAAYAVPVADTVGCGDAAMGGWIASMLQRPQAAPWEHLDMAAATAAVAATRVGPYAPSEEEVHQLQEEAAMRRGP